MKNQSTNKKQLTSRLSAYAAASGALLLIAGNTNSQVVYSGSQNLQLAAPDEFLELDLDGDALNDFRFMIYSNAESYGNSYSAYKFSYAYAAILNPRTNTYNSWINRSTTIVLSSTSSTQLDIPAALDSGIPIASNNSGWAGTDDVSWSAVLGVWMNRTYSTVSSSYSVHLDEGDFKGEENFLGVRFHIGDELHYGWIRLMTNEDVDTLTIIDWAYQSTPDLAILAGDGLGLDLPPWIEITGNDDSNIDNVTLTLKATEEITGFTAEDILVTNGTASDFTEITAGLEYSVVVTASSEGEVRMEIAAGAVEDLTANANIEITASWAYDVTPPTTEIIVYRDSISNSPWLDGMIRFSEPVTTLDVEGFSITNGQLETLDYNSHEGSYYFSAYAYEEGEASLSINEGAVTDNAGNPIAKTGVSWVWDKTPPELTMEISSDETAEQEMEIALTFSETIFGIRAYDFIVQNGTAESLTTVTEGLEYTLIVSADETGIVIATLDELSVWDQATNYCASSSIGWYYNPMSIDQKLNKEVRIYPNPANERIQIRSERPVNISIYDIQGSLILEEQDIQNSGIDISGFEQGIYLVKVQDGEEFYYQKLIKD